MGSGHAGAASGLGCGLYREEDGAGNDGKTFHYENHIRRGSQGINLNFRIVWREEGNGHDPRHGQSKNLIPQEKSCAGARSAKD
jgi:hypothetical protein